MINIFKKKPKNAIHPDYKKLIQPVFEIEGKWLYEFKDLGDMPHQRYAMFDRFKTEINMRMDADTLQESIKSCLDNANKGQFTKVIHTLSVMEVMTEMLISMDAHYRLVSCAYFWKDEDLTDYDFAINDEKIVLFKKYKVDDFFLKEPIKKFLPQMNTSLQGLEVFLRQEIEFKKLLSSALKKNPGKNAKAT